MAIRPDTKTPSAPDDELQDGVSPFGQKTSGTVGDQARTSRNPMFLALALIVLVVGGYLAYTYDKAETNVPSSTTHMSAPSTPPVAKPAQ